MLVAVAHSTKLTLPFMCKGWILGHTVQNYLLQHKINLVLPKVTYDFNISLVNTRIEHSFAQGRYFLNEYW